MLALEVVGSRSQAGHGPSGPPTFVFDEVDAGVGGRAATDVGARLAALAEHAQVIVVTHLAQVAAFADRHLVVHKADDGRITSSSVSVVEGDARLRELSRMMGGDPDSEAGLAHASDLLDQTRGTRGSSTRRPRSRARA
jgi:DNA repair protein RecN (Recombination protein N)